MRVWSLGLWVLLGSCRPAQAPARVAPLPLVAVPLVVPEAPRSSATPSPPPSVVAALSPSVDPDPPSPTPPTLSPPPPLVLFEPAYSALGHPRLATEMQTLGRDEELMRWALGGSSNAAHPSNRAGYHPATRVVVDVSLLSRAPLGSTKRLLRVARSSGYWPLRGCFEDAQRLTRKTERAARVRLTLSASGKVLGARNLGPAAERDYARCVLEKVRGLDFTPGVSRKLDLEVSVKQWPGDAPVPPHAPKDAAPLRLAREANAALQGLGPAISECYQSALAQDPQLWGRIAFRLKLREDGTIQDATPSETQFPSVEVAECARRSVVGARLPAAEVKELSVAVRLGQPPAPPLPPAPGSPGSPPAPPTGTDGSPPSPLTPPAPPTPAH